MTTKFRYSDFVYNLISDQYKFIILCFRKKKYFDIIKSKTKITCMPKYYHLYHLIIIYDDADNI